MLRFLSLALVLVACGARTELDAHELDDGVDAGVDARADVGVDVGVDALTPDVSLPDTSLPDAMLRGCSPWGARARFEDDASLPHMAMLLSGNPPLGCPWRLQFFLYDNGGAPFQPTMPPRGPNVFELEIELRDDPEHEEWDPALRTTYTPADGTPRMGDATMQLYLFEPPDDDCSGYECFPAGAGGFIRANGEDWSATIGFEGEFCRWDSWCEF